MLGCNAVQEFELHYNQRAPWLMPQVAVATSVLTLCVTRTLDQVKAERGLPK